MKVLTIAAAAAIALLAPATMVAAQSATPELKTKSGTIGTPASGKGQVVFYRPGSLMGAALGCTVHEGAAQIARLGSGKYWVSVVEPGKHSYNTEGEAKDVLNLEVEADETYFVKCNIGMGVMSGRANLSPASTEDFAKKAKGLALWKPKGTAEDTAQ
ncbi:DUF2846 domain-containing protein [Sphingomonas sp. HMP6]|uniref:DUF2846 domain-containing protein n=1 Tax=Sphingomonas sp. HMP6 TaxID=1517551 RepID=UPI001596B70F|nr:DUF2846 domain-containing protein [Sphingomonas sp. HMP6]BCA57254.1 hypothetical protein HMP06_0023 [Sphingomonas sp. HMP6]